MRIVSLLPSATEIVYALGLGDDLVGVTFECDFPPSARTDNAVVVGGLDTKSLSPREIDDYVRDRMAAGDDLYTLHAGALAALDPDLILTQDLCRVCAIPSGQVEDALEHLGCRADVVALDPHSLAEVLETVETVAARAGAPDAASDVVSALRLRLAEVEAAVSDRRRPRVAVVEWVDPPFTAGHWVPDLVLAAGGQPVAASPHTRSVETTWRVIADASPGVVVVAPCGYHLDGAYEQARMVLTDLPSAAQVWAIDGDALVVRPGPRLVEGVEALAGVLHPDVRSTDDTAVRRLR